MGLQRHIVLIVLRQLADLIEPPETWSNQSVQATQNRTNTAKAKAHDATGQVTTRMLHLHLALPANGAAP